MKIIQQISETISTATVIDNNLLYRGLWIACQRVRGSAAVALLLWLLSRIDDDALFVYNKELVETFAADMEKELGYSYKPFTVEDGVRELQRAKAIERVSRGTYKINQWVWMGETAPALDPQVIKVKLNDKGLVIKGKTPGPMLPREDEAVGITKEAWDSASAELRAAGEQFREREIAGLGMVRVPEELAQAVEGPAQVTTAPLPPPLKDEHPVEEAVKPAPKPSIFSGMSWD